MAHRFASIATLAVFCMSALIWFGCSDDTIRTVVSDDDYVSNSETPYFLPLTEGFTTIYRVTRATGGDETITLRVGRQVQIGTLTANEWFSDDGEVLDTAYILMSSDAAYYYDAADADPEKMLGFPLVAGSSWERFSDTYADDDFITIITSITDGDDGDNGDTDETSTLDGSLAKTIPTTGSNLMTVVGEEELQLENGQFLSHTVKLYNDASTPGKKNYYWYAEGIGLVKYIIGTTDGSYPRGDEVGELIDFGT